MAKMNWDRSRMDERVRNHGSEPYWRALQPRSIRRKVVQMSDADRRAEERLMRSLDRDIRRVLEGAGGWIRIDLIVRRVQALRKSAGKSGTVTTGQIKARLSANSEYQLQAFRARIR